jgi:hypothetical protein
MRHAITHHQTIAAAERAAKLPERIKIETRWLLIATPARTFKIDEESYAADRAALVLFWPAIRQRRLDVSGTFYDVAAETASLLTHLIEIRRQRAADRRAQ